MESKGEEWTQPTVLARDHIVGDRELEGNLPIVITGWHRSPSSTSLPRTSEEHSMAHGPKVFPVLKSRCLQLGLRTPTPGVSYLIPPCPHDHSLSAE